MILGHTYTRDEISEFAGGSTQGMFPTRDGKVTCACLLPEMNGAAPLEVWLGTGVEERDTVKSLVKGKPEFPLFLRDDRNRWRYWGRYRVERMVDSMAVIQAASKAGDRPISAVLDLSPVGATWGGDVEKARRQCVLGRNDQNGGPTKYWVTVHWPKKVGEQPKPDNLFVYIPEGRQHAGRELAAGDLVIIYETEGGKTSVKCDVNGNEITEARGRGRQGAVAIVKVQQPLICDPAVQVSKYTDGTTAKWSWKAQTKLVAEHGFIPREEFNVLVGRSPAYTWRLASSVARITEAQFRAVVARFEANPLPPDPVEALVERYRRAGGRRRGPGGEGEAHRLLKEFVAADPAAALGEAGLSTVRVEYPFPTNDRADLVLKDAFGCFIAVEVEVAQGFDQVEGCLQAIKYRHMLAVLEGRSFAETRSWLVAYELAPEICELCIRYGVTPHCILPAKVEAWRRTHPPPPEVRATTGPSGATDEER